MKKKKGILLATAVFALLLILPNTNKEVSASMQKIPLVGKVFTVITVRDFQVQDERQTADVKVPKITVEDTTNSEKLEETVNKINFDVQEITDKIINEFKENQKYEEGYQDLMIDSKVLTDNDDWFSLELLVYQGAGSGYEQRYHYTINKATGEEAVLSDFYGENYVKIISEEVKTQMRQQMAEDEMVHYWVDEEDVPEWNFQAIKEDQDFYVNENGKIVICFNEYEVAPGYMGYVEFVLDN